MLPQRAIRALRTNVNARCLSFAFPFVGVCPWDRAALGKGGDGKKGYSSRGRHDYSTWERPWAGATIHSRHDRRFQWIYKTLTEEQAEWLRRELGKHNSDGTDRLWTWDRERNLSFAMMLKLRHVAGNTLLAPDGTMSIDELVQTDLIRLFRPGTPAESTQG